METNFLDDKLYNHFVNYDFICNTEDELAKKMMDCLNELYKICDSHWKPLLDEIHENKGNFKQMPTKTIKYTIDKVFKLWDLFVEKISKDKEKCCFVNFLNKYSYKTMFFENEEVNRIYYTL